MKFLANVQKLSKILKQNQVDHILKVTQPGAAYLLANPSNINATLDCIFDKFSWSAHHFSMMDQSVAGRGKVHFSKYSHEDLTKACIKIRGCLTIFFRMFQTLMNDNVWGTKVFCFYQPFCRPLQTREPPWLRFNGFPQGIWIRSSVGGNFSIGTNSSGCLFASPTF